MPTTELLQQYIVFDIDSNSIGAMIVDKQKKHDHVIHYDRKYIHGEKNLSFDEFFLKTQRILAEMSEKMSSMLLGEHFEVYVNLSAPWVSSQKRILEYQKQKDFTFSQELARNIIQREIELPFSDNPDYTDRDLVTLIERRTLDVYVNGYPTRNPYGETARTIELHALASVMSTETKEVFESIIERYFHRVPVFFSNTFMNYQSVKTVLPYQDNLIILDVSGRTTEISIIKHDHLTHLASFPVGSDHVVRAIAKKLSFSVHKTYSMIEMLDDRILDESYQKKINTAMSLSFIVWKDFFYKTLQSLSKEGVLPSEICLLTPPIIQNWFTEQLLSAEELSTHMYAGHKVSVVDMQQVFVQNKKMNLDIADQNMLMIHNFIETIYGTTKTRS